MKIVDCIKKDDSYGYIKFSQEEEYIKDFLSLKKKLYDNDTNTEDTKTVRIFLLGTHPLSKYFTLHKFLIYTKEGVVGRFVLTVYPNDTTCYLGFYEAVKDTKIAMKIFEVAEEFAKSKGFSNIVGPVDASFWYGYRLKINLFDKLPYTGEPYNLPYYLDQFLEMVIKFANTIPPIGIKL